MWGVPRSGAQGGGDRDAQTEGLLPLSLTFSPPHPWFWWVGEADLEPTWELLQEEAEPMGGDGASVNLISNVGLSEEPMAPILRVERQPREAATALSHTVIPTLV